MRKIPSRLIGVLTVGALICSNLLAHADEGTARPHRYRDLVTELSLAPGCKSALSKLYESGKDLSFSPISEQLVPLERWKKNPPLNRVAINGMDFYHYTSADFTQYLYAKSTDRKAAEVSIRRDGGYEKIFDWVKKKNLNSCCGASFKAGLYIAADPWSSRQFGPNRFSMKLNPQTRVLITEYHSGDFSLGSPNLWDSIRALVEARSKKLLKKCVFEDLKPLILEDSGVQMIAYDHFQTEPWFILLNSSSIEESKFEPNP